MCWRVYPLNLLKAHRARAVVSIDFSTLNSRSESDMELLYLWCKEGWQRSVLDEYNTQKQHYPNSYGAMLQTGPCLRLYGES